jgi:hypothetical protein
MALSQGGLAVIILFLAFVHAGGFVGLHYYNRKRAQQGQEPATLIPTLSESTQGILRWVLLGLICLSWIFSVAAAAACTFISISADGLDLGIGFKCIDLGPLEDVISEAELAVYQSYGPTSYTFAVFNCLFTTSGVVMVILMITALNRGRKRTWLALRLFMYFSMWCAIFTFYFRQEIPLCELDGISCGLGGAGVAQVFNVLILIAICVLLMLTEYSEEKQVGGHRGQKLDGNEPLSKSADEEDGREQPQKFETEVHMPDGTIQREVETVNPDGSKTVTKTIEQPDDDDDFINASEDESEDDTEADGDDGSSEDDTEADGDDGSSEDDTEANGDDSSSEDDTEADDNSSEDDSESPQRRD